MIFYERFILGYFRATHKWLKVAYAILLAAEGFVATVILAGVLFGSWHTELVLSDLWLFVWPLLAIGFLAFFSLLLYGEYPRLGLYSLRPVEASSNDVTCGLGGILALADLSVGFVLLLVAIG